MTNTSRRSSARVSGTPFIPSPQWLSESPARPKDGASPASYGMPTPQIDHPARKHVGADPPITQLRSPIPPPPANLYQGGTSAFNVDPGVPFLATVGPSSDGGAPSERGSPKDFDTSFDSKRFVGGLVTGIKKAVKRSIRSSQRRPQGSSEHLEPTARYSGDSGYEDFHPHFPSPQPNYEIPEHMATTPEFHHSSIPSKRIRDQHQPPPFASQTPHTVQHDIAPPEMIGSPVSADPEFGSDYARMDPTTPPRTIISITTQLKRFQDFVEGFSELPWVAKGRITVDYEPEKTRRRDEPKRHPAILWKSEDIKREDAHRHGILFGRPDADEWSLMSGSIGVPVAAPRKGLRSAMDLDAEFEPGRTPRQPPTIALQTQTPAPPYPVLPPGSILLQSGPPPPLPLYPPIPEHPPNSIPPIPQNPPMHMASPMQPITQNPSMATAQLSPQYPSLNMGRYVSPAPPANQIEKLDPPPFGWPPSKTSRQMPDLQTPTYEPQPQLDTIPTISFSPNPGQSRSPSAVIPSAVPSPSNAPPRRLPTKSPGRTPYVPASQIPRDSSSDISKSTNETDIHNPKSPTPTLSRRSRKSHSETSRSNASTGTRSFHIHMNSDYKYDAAYDHHLVQRSPHIQHHGVAQGGHADGEWEAYPREMAGYVPAHLAEHYYGDQYGPGIHAARPQYPGPSAIPSTADESRRSSRASSKRK